MRPEKSRDTLQSAALSRARMFIKADLGWVRGFPLASGGRKVEWVIVPREDGHSPERRSLSRQDIQKAVYSYNRLVRHFPRALPRAVENIRAWKGNLPVLFGILKATIQEGRPFPASIVSAGGVFPAKAVKAAEDLKARHPALGRFIDALGFILLLTPEELASALKWTGLRSAWIQSLQAPFPGDESFISLVSLWELSRRSSYRDAEFLVSILGDERALRYPTHGWIPYLNQLHETIVGSAGGLFRRTLPAAPVPILGDRLLEFVAWALRQSQDVRRRALQLLKTVLDCDFLTPWTAAWQKLEATPWARQHIPRRLSAAAAARETERIKSRIGVLLQNPPPEIHIAKLLDHIRLFSSGSRASEYPAVRRALEAVPPIHNGILARAAFLHDWADSDKNSSPRFAHALKRFAQYALSGRRSANWLRPWETVLKHWAEDSGWAWSVLEEILREEKDPATIDLCFQALERAPAASPEGLNCGEANRLVDLVKALKDVGLALSYAESLRSARAGVTRLDEGLIRCARALCREEKEFGRLYKRLDKLGLGDNEIAAVLRLDGVLRAKGWAGFVREAFLDREGAAVLRIAERLKALTSLGGACDPPERGCPGGEAGWISQYPAEFRERLAALACLNPKAGRTARRIFGEDYIPREALDREIAVLEAKVKKAPANGLLVKRLANLRERRASVVSVAPGRSARLKKRLERAVRREIFDQWERRLDDEFLRRLETTLGAASIPPGLAAPDFLPVLISMLGLKKPFREIGLELLRRRCGPPPWNLYDHPANRAFLERLAKKSVDPAPWVQPGVVRVVIAENGKKLQVGFEDDPLEIFRMGAYFRTCLMPGGVNFYSVIPNAADINKRVLFARDEGGKVAGRCLFALSGEGGVLTFHPYAHDKSLGFSDIVSRCASELASRMKTAVVSRGTIECLVAPKWYDDGPRDTGFYFPFLQGGSDFRSQIKTLKPEAFLDAVRAAVGPLALNSLTLSPIAMLPELEARPELIVPLLALLERCDDLPAEVWSRAAELAKQAGRLDQARRILRQRIIPYELRQLKREYIGEVDKQVIELALEIDPSATLRLFRQTRPRGVRRDEHEPPYRREYVAGALERLGRDELARRLRSRIKQGRE